MIFWRKFNKFRVPTWPDKDGWYLCTVNMTGEEEIMYLCWNKHDRTFKNEERQAVFNSYEVLVNRSDDVIGDYCEQIFKDSFCDLTDFVLAWKKEPKPYEVVGKGAKKK